MRFGFSNAVSQVAHYVVRPWGVSTCALAVLGVTACPVSDRYQLDGGPQIDGTSALPPPSADCQLYQDAFCAFYAERCGILPAALCLNQSQGTRCRSDAQASDCAAGFDQAPCRTPPRACGLADVADPEPAIAACNDYVDAQCHSNIRCGLFRELAECRADPRLNTDCSRAISIGLGFDQCLEELATRACDRGAPSCDNVVHLSPP